MGKARPLALVACAAWGALAWLASACSNDIDVAANYRQQVVAYARICAEDSVQWLRIERSFLTEGNALDIARNHPDSVLAPPDTQVTLIRLGDDGAPQDSIALERWESIRDGGLFGVAPHVLYKTGENQRLKPGATYTLRVQMPLCSAQATCALPVRVKVLQPKDSAVQGFWSAGGYTLQWAHRVGTAVYTARARVFYWDEMTQEDSTLRFLDVPMEREVLGVGIPAGRQYASILLTDTLRANFARRGLLTDGKPQRYALTEFFVESYGEEGYQYHRTASRILQSQHDPNVYTNIVDGRGVFFGQGRASIKVYLDERDQERVYDLLED